MVRLYLQDTTAVTVSGTVVALPGVYDLPAISVGSSEFAQGVVVVSGGVGVQVSDLHPHYEVGFSLFICLFGVLGLFAARAFRA